MKSGHESYKQRYEKHTSKPDKYDPNNLLTGMIKKLNLKNDAALSRALEVARFATAVYPWERPCSFVCRKSVIFPSRNYAT